jgi:hypothetical protein
MTTVVLDEEVPVATRRERDPRAIRGSITGITAP